MGGCYGGAVNCLCWSEERVCWQVRTVEHDEWVTKVQFSDDGAQVISGSGDNTVISPHLGCMFGRRNISIFCMT